MIKGFTFESSFYWKIYRKFRPKCSSRPVCLLATLVYQVRDPQS